MDSLESRRGLYEDLEVIEDAIAKRFHRNPELYYIGLDKMPLLYRCRTGVVPLSREVTNNSVYGNERVRRSSKQVQAQLHEIRLFLDDYYKKIRELKQMRRFKPQATNLRSQLQDFKDDIDQLNSGSASGGVTTKGDKVKEYAMRSGGHNTILSIRAQALNINDLFTREEQYGEYMDLEPLYGEWLQTIKSTECNLLQFVKQWGCFLDQETYLMKPPMDRKSPRYMLFLNKLCHYIEEFFHKKYCLIDRTVVHSHLRRDYEQYVNKPVGRERRFFCVVCNKHFKGVSVFDSHTGGKQHVKQLRNRHKELFSEYKLFRYMSLLQDELTSTQTLIERRQAFTSQERIEENKYLDRVYNAPTYSPDEDEQIPQEDSAVVTNTASSMPVGPDGIPMPFWLYKLQGLDVNYTCEICSNETFQGRRAFQRHFNGSKHRFRLKCLGIEPSPAFNGISSIDEAQQLQANSTNTDTAAATATAEVEDRQGNVMSQQDFLELQRQGLL
ncbi:hypothetical protein C6P45_005161 [Maudiozyma exigua]|uniref:Matrin-type domain-containing protein n=1 Tax=Maudiozyma exigua TaxID=34358 RepID=A0A9P7BB23_MAUEX|nr:hypothetical protein C6P45_005161 [Kazachstania exigua]